MEKIENRLLEEWKVNLDLLKFYEQLKQQRFSHFLTIQTAFLAMFALVAKEALATSTTVSMTSLLVSLASLAVIPIAPLLLCFFFLRLDARNRAFIDTANTRLLLLEDEWKVHFPDNHFTTYHNQFGVLSRREEQLVEKYRAVRGLTQDPYPKLIRAPSAHASETAILRSFLWIWIFLCSAGWLHLLWHLAHPDWRPA